jgi:hypothetical protein
MSDTCFNSIPMLKQFKAEASQPRSHPKLNHELKFLSRQRLGQSPSIKSNADLSKILAAHFEHSLIRPRSITF